MRIDAAKQSQDCNLREGGREREKDITSYLEIIGAINSKESFNTFN